jgi:hypothetical protein
LTIFDTHHDRASFEISSIKDYDVGKVSRAAVISASLNWDWHPRKTTMQKSNVSLLILNLIVRVRIVRLALLPARQVALVQPPVLDEPTISVEKVAF